MEVRAPDRARGAAGAGNAAHAAITGSSAASRACWVLSPRTSTVRLAAAQAPRQRFRVRHPRDILRRISARAALCEARRGRWRELPPRVPRAATACAAVLRPRCRPLRGDAPPGEGRGSSGGARAGFDVVGPSRSGRRACSLHHEAGPGGRALQGSRPSRSTRRPPRSPPPFRCGFDALSRRWRGSFPHRARQLTSPRTAMACAGRRRAGAVRT